MIITRDRVTTSFASDREAGSATGNINMGGGYKSRKRKEASRQGYETSRNDRRTRDGEKDNLEHLHAEFLVAGERIA